MASLTKKRLIAATVGLFYAVIYGFWTMIATGGGHVNFVWIWLFIAVGFLGLYYPLMAVMAVNLRNFVTKLIFGTLIGFYVIASTVILVGWVNEPATDRPSDFSRAMRVNGADGLAFCAALHFLPVLVFSFFLIRPTLYKSSVSDDETTVLDLS